MRAALAALLHMCMLCAHGPAATKLSLRAPPGWVQTNRPTISKGEKVCVAARSLFLWNRLPLEVVYARSERTRLSRQLRGFTVNRQLTVADTAASKQSASGWWSHSWPSCRNDFRLLSARLNADIRRGADPAERFVFATSTTWGHQLVGEERFSVEWHQKDNSVWCVCMITCALSSALASILECHTLAF